MKSQSTLVPKYMLDFKCIGPSCEDSCCIGWRVDVNKQTYRSLTNYPDRALRESFKNAMEKRESKSRSNIQYAYMKMDTQTGCCSMLNEEKLCSIQANIGEHYLSPTCATYPRNIFAVNDTQEISAVMSCPEAARLALLNPDKMEFAYSDDLTQNNLLVQSTIRPENKEGNFMDLFWDIRVFSIEILQNRELNFPHRLIILGIFIEELQGLIHEKRDTEEEILLLINRYKQMINNDEELRNFDMFPANHEFQFILLNNIISKHLNETGAYHRFKECIQDYLEGLSNQEFTNEQSDLVDRYGEAYNLYYRPFISEHEYIFENYAVNFIFSHLFPKSKNGNVFEIYVTLVSHYVLLKLLLIGMSSKHKGLNTELVIKLIQSFTKKSEHSNVYVKNTLEVLTAENYLTMGHMSLLIKN